MKLERHIIETGWKLKGITYYCKANDVFRQLHDIILV